MEYVWTLYFVFFFCFYEKSVFGALILSHLSASYPQLNLLYFCVDALLCFACDALFAFSMRFRLTALFRICNLQLNLQSFVV